MIAGSITDKELDALKKIVEISDKPVAMLIGGAKAIDKLKAMKYIYFNRRWSYVRDLIWR